jgi:hypothetical protein
MQSNNKPTQRTTAYVEAQRVLRDRLVTVTQGGHTMREKAAVMLRAAHHIEATLDLQGFLARFVAKLGAMKSRVILRHFET